MNAFSPIALPPQPVPATRMAMPGAGPERYLALVLPRLATDRIARMRWGAPWRSAGRPDAPPIIVSRHEANCWRVAALDELAEAAGLRRGQGLADARAIVPGAEVIEEDSGADRRLLEGIADWCDRYTPLVALDAPDGLFLDISGCAHLFGGERALLDDLLPRLFHQGFDARAAIAATPGAAWASARFGAAGIVAADGEAETLAPLPVAALRLAPDILSGLERVGLKRVGHLLGAPRAPLARRFGKTLLRRLDQALGLERESLSPRLPAPLLAAERRLFDPVSLVDDIARILGQLAARLAGGLERRGSGARLLELALFRVDGAVRRLRVRASRPLRDPAAVCRLFAEKLTAAGDALDAGYGFDVLRLAALEEGRLDARQTSLTQDSDHESEALAALADRIAARFEGMPVLQPVAVESHVPERAFALMPPGPEPGAGLAPSSAGPAGRPVLRPARLIEPPEPVEAVSMVPDGAPMRFRWRRRLHRILRAEGPERIAGEWWRDGRSVRPRDYFRVEDEDGRRYWLFREGLFGARGDGAAPQWFLHGLFA